MTSKPVTLSVLLDGGSTLLKLHSVGKKSCEVMELIVRLSPDDRAWLREVLR